MTKFETIHQLRAVVNDEGRPMAERKAAARHLVRLKDTAVDLNIPDDDAELVQLCAPWKTDTDWDRQLAATFHAFSGGHPVAEAREMVKQDRLSRARYAAARDVTLPMLERLATAEFIFELSPDNSPRNNFTPERMLAQIAASTP